MAKTTNRRQEIITTARQLFQRKSYDHTSIQDVMDALGIAKGTVYHYFRSKEELLEAVVASVVDESVENMTKVLKTAKGKALEKFALVVQAASVAAEHEDTLKELHKPGNEAMHTRLLAVAIAKQAPLYAEIISQGCEEGVFSVKNPLECAEFLLSAVQFLTDRGIYPWKDEDLTRRIHALPTLIEALLSAPAGSFNFLSTYMSAS